MKFAMCQELFEGWDWERQCRFLKEVGYEGVEVAPFSLGPQPTQLSKQERQKLKAQAEDCGLQVVGLHWLLAKTEGFHLTTADKAVREATAQYLADLGDLCADLGGRVMVFGSPAQRSLQPGVSYEQAMEHAAEVFSSCLPRLADRGVVLCMEPLTKKETDFINTCEQAVELIQRVDHPNLRLHQDVKAMLGAETEPIPLLIEKYASFLEHFHANDANLLGPGMGETDFGPIFQALLKINYQGWVSVEVFDSTPGMEQIARSSLRYMKETLERVRGQD